jgi:lysophospholipase L1-like esterase
VDIVFLGDSITEGWRDQRPGFFTPGRIGRGIGGQTTAQMVLRMMPDVVALKPRAVHIMAGTNDVAGNTGPMTPQMTQDNFRAMAAIARHHKINVILASIPPAASFPWRPGLETRAPIRALNAWLREFARHERFTYIDYHAALATSEEGMRPGLASDGVHPTDAGYDVMASVAEPVLRRFVRARKARS